MSQAFDIYGDEKVQAILEGICSQPIIDKPFNETDNPKPMCEGIKMFNGEVFDTNKWCSGGKSLVLSKNSKVGKAKTAPEKDVKQQTENETVDLKKTAGPGGTKVVTQSLTTTDPEVKAAKGVQVECVSTTPPQKPAFDSKAKSAASGMESDAKDNKKFMKGTLSDPRRWDLLGKFVKTRLGADTKKKDNIDKIMSHIKEAKAQFAKK